MPNGTPSISVSPSENERRTQEELSLSHSEYVLIQTLRACRKKSIAIIDIGGDGVPKRVRFIESPCVEL